jgi:threonine/homoserine/homoserine lactone efflux protein
MLTYLIFGITYAFAAAVQPGPFQAYIISQIFSRGWKPVLPAAFAPILSDIPIFILIMLILTNVSEVMIHALQIGGGLLLFFMAYKTYNDLRSHSKNTVQKNISNKMTLFKAALVNFLNPAPYLGWALIMGPIFIEGWNNSPAFGIALLISFYSTMVICLVAIIMLFGTASKLGPRVTYIAANISLVGLIAFGVYEIWKGSAYFILL